MLYDNDFLLLPYKNIIEERYRLYREKSQLLQGAAARLSENCNSHLYYGLHFTGERWLLREWAPNASAIFMLSKGLVGRIGNCPCQRKRFRMACYTSSLWSGQGVAGSACLRIRPARYRIPIRRPSQRRYGRGSPISGNIRVLKQGRLRWSMRHI